MPRRPAEALRAADERKRNGDMKKTVSLSRALGVGALAVVTGSLVTGMAVYGIARPSGELADVYSSLAEAQSIVESQFVGEYDMDNVRDYVLTGYATGLGDRWTSYMSEDYYQEYLDSAADSTVGIGVTVSEKKNDDGSTVLKVEQIAHGSPAEEGGIDAYDEITAVDGKTVDELGGYQGAVDAVLGEVGKQVTLRVRRYATGESADLTLTRQEYEQIHVTSRMLDGDIGYICIEKFTDQTDEQFRDALDDLVQRGADSLIFDLRNNPGGQLGALIHSLDPLLPEGNIISLKSKSGKSETYTSDADAVDLPMAVLINEESYSAAEFFAAALQEYGKATIVGDKTVGKGYSQQQFPLSGGGCLNLSTNCYYTPNGESLIGKGVTPDIPVSLSEDKTERFYALTDGEDDQLQAAIQAVQP